VFCVVLMLRMMDPWNYCGARISNDCQTCGSAQARVRRSLLFECLPSDKPKRQQMGMRDCRNAGYPGDQIKAAGQEGIVESAWVPIVPLCGTPRGGCDGAHVRPGLRPVDEGPPAPPRGRKAGNGIQQKEPKDAADRKGSEATSEKSEESIYSTRTPKISHAEI
jgi:hypothetical protein